MAQDLAATPAGRTAVEPDERGMLTVNAPKLGMMTAAATGAHERRIAELEAQLDALLGKSKDKGSAAAPRTGTADTAALDAAQRSQGGTIHRPRSGAYQIATDTSEFSPSARSVTLYHQHDARSPVESYVVPADYQFQGQDGRSFRADSVGTVPTVRYPDYAPPTARYADVPSEYSYDYSQPTEVIPVAVGSADPTPYGGVDFAALDEAQRRQGGTVREETY